MTSLAESEQRTLLQLAEIIARLWESDPHDFSTRPCQTCRTVTGVLGRPLGCIAKANRTKP